MENEKRRRKLSKDQIKKIVIYVMVVLAIIAIVCLILNQFEADIEKRNKVNEKEYLRRTKHLHQINNAFDGEYVTYYLKWPTKNEGFICDPTLLTAPFTRISGYEIFLNKKYVNYIVYYNDYQKRMVTDYMKEYDIDGYKGYYKKEIDKDKLCYTIYPEDMTWFIAARYNKNEYSLDEIEADLKVIVDDLLD